MELKTSSQADQLESVNDVVVAAADHAEQLTEQAAMLDGMLRDTRDSSDSAVKAANAYADIVTAIGNARQAADDAVVASDNANLKVNPCLCKETK